MGRIIIATLTPYPIRMAINRHWPNTHFPLPHHQFLSSHHPKEWKENSLNNSELPTQDVDPTPSPPGHRPKRPKTTPTYQQKRPSIPHSPKTPQPPPSISTRPNCPISPPLLPLTLHRGLYLPDILSFYQYPTTLILESPQ